LKRILLTVSVFFLLILPNAIKAVDVANRPITASKHNLATWGPGDIKATSESQVCKFCHAVHGASRAPLWGHKLSTATYHTYSSATLKSPRNQPDMGSKLCLSCHDGTVAVGGTTKGNRETEIELTSSTAGKLSGALGSANRKLTATSTAYYGTDLANPISHISHPISIEVSTELVQATLDAGKDWKLKGMNAGCPNFKTLGDECVYPLQPTKNTYGTTRTNVGIQCTTCHDAHNDQFGMFMREKVSFDNFSCANYGVSDGGFCLHCHVAKPTVDLYKSTYRTGN
jgi:hypothetical protein